MKALSSYGKTACLVLPDVPVLQAAEARVTEHTRGVAERQSRTSSLLHACELALFRLRARTPLNP